MALTEKQKKHLRSLAHKLNPVVIVGQHGLTEPVLQELEPTLEHHELIKVRVNAGDREERDAMIREMCERTGAELVQRVGHVAVLYRPARKPRITLPQA